jgi:hypothetical protein
MMIVFDMGLLILRRKEIFSSAHITKKKKIKELR